MNKTRSLRLICWNVLLLACGFSFALITVENLTQSSYPEASFEKEWKHFQYIQDPETTYSAIIDNTTLPLLLAEKDSEKNQPTYEIEKETPWTSPTPSYQEKTFIKDVAIESSFSDPSSLPFGESPPEKVKKVPVHQPEERLPGDIPSPPPEELAKQEDLHFDSPAENNEPYRLKIGDKLYISIYGEKGTGRQVSVDPAGFISYLFVSQTQALGKTIDEVKAVLNEKIKRFFKFSYVTVTGVEFGGDQYTIIGEVNLPGTKIIQGKTTILTALGQAGGVTIGAFRDQTIDFSDLRRAFLARQGEYIPVDFEALVKEGDRSQDVELKNGDYIYIPSVMSQDISILGEVNRPMMLSFINCVTLLEALAEAQGLTPYAGSRIAILRGSLSCPVEYLVDINRIFKGCEGDILLEPGDIVYVPSSQFSTLKEVIRSAVASFVASVASGYGTVAVSKIFNSNAVNQPVQVLNLGTTGTSSVQPAIIVP